MVLFKTGEHPDHHTPNDTWERIDDVKMQKIARLVYLAARSLASSPTARPPLVPQRQTMNSR